MGGKPDNGGGPGGGYDQGNGGVGRRDSADIDSISF
jgi:hypothetical protein